MERSIRYRWLWIWLVMLFTVTSSASSLTSGELAAAESGAARAPEESWIIQWHSAPSQEFWNQSEVSSYYEASQVTVARPKPGLETKRWVQLWSESGLVDSLQPNQRVKAAKSPNDPLFANQRYLKQIRAEAAWDIATSNDMIIAVVDTGVDMTHPDLEGRLVQGVNLVHPGAEPNDDNGHGTNVAGVIAASGDNDKGTAGLLWNARIMPIKALEADGNGDEDKLGEGIRYAVQNGAKIVVLSLGLNKYSSYMEKVVREAEDAGVLLVAASGNEGDAVKYPAAYDTVLAVGGVGSDNRPEPMSNYGPELDIVAPWVVFTTASGGGYDYRDGTSMAAPQAAATAALAWTVRPGLKPVEMRNLLRQTAQDIGAAGWDQQTGYGMLRVDRAVTEEPKRDIYEPNNRQNAAKAIPSNKSITAYMEAGEEDWFYWEAPYDGVARYRISGASALIDVAHVSESGIEIQTQTNPTGSELQVQKGRHYVRVSGASGTSYTLHVDYGIYRDPFEDNDRQYKAYTLTPRSQMLVGTFDHAQDQDWFSIPVDQAGTLQLKVTPDTARMDPVLTIVRKGGKELVIDHNGDGEPESFQMEVTPGLYYIKVSNISSYTYPVIGEYILDIHLATSYEDPYEPNNKSYQATALNFDENYLGVIDPETDVDWYRFKLDGESEVQMDFGLLPDPDTLSVQLLDASLKPRSMSISIEDRNSWSAETTLPAGTYYFKVSSLNGARQQLYSIRVHADRLVEGYADVYGHWAESSLVKLINGGYVNGYGGRQLYPDRLITRAEAAVMLERILKPSAAPPPGFNDVPSDHWAYVSVARLYRAGVINGFSKTTFAPDRNITRMEMMTMLANATGKKGYAGSSSPFSDVSASYWGSPILRQLKQEGWAEGYADGTFRPDRPATRAELMYLTVKMLQL
jgi:subtilisin family serine protease